MKLEGKNYCGLTIDWNYDKEYVYISMPTYINRSLKIFLCPIPKNPYYEPHKWTLAVYGQIIQYAKGPYNTQTLDEKGTKYVHTKVVSLLYYSWEVDPTMLPDLNEIAARQYKHILQKQKCY